jgi:hypothetical protein
LLPRGEREGIVEQSRDGEAVERRWSDETGCERGLVARFPFDRDEVQRQHRGAFEAAVRVGLRVPVQVTERRRKRERTVLRPLMVSERDVQS